MTTTSNMPDTRPVAYEQVIPDVIPPLQEVHKVLDRHGLDRTIHHLVVIRASQMNGCAHCLKMHLREAREHGESNDRLDRVIVWRHVSDFSAAERAALAFTEALTALDAAADFRPLRAELRAHFSVEQIAALTVTVAMINMWNRLGVTRH